MKRFRGMWGRQFQKIKGIGGCEDLPYQGSTLMRDARCECKTICAILCYAGWGYGGDGCMQMRDTVVVRQVPIDICGSPIAIACIMCKMSVLEIIYARSHGKVGTHHSMQDSSSK